MTDSTDPFSGRSTGSVSWSAGLDVSGFEDLVEIGRGGFGIVYRARQADFDRTVAIKVLTSALDERARGRFERERRAVGSLSGHPHIITVHASGLTADGRPFIVMEYLSGGSLADRLARGPLPWAEAAAIGVKVASAVEAAHGAGVLHRDIKPANVLLSAYGEPKLADFGIARLEGAARTTTSGVVVATIAYAPPEILDGKPATAACDVYSLGATLHALIAGHPAFVHESDETLLPVYARIASDAVPDLRPRGVPDAVCRVLEQAMAKDPAQRLGSAAELCSRLQEASLGRDSAATPDTRSAALAPPGSSPTVPLPQPRPAAPETTSKRRPRRRRLVALVVVLALASGVGWLVSGRSSGKGGARTSQIFLESRDSRGSHPFTPSVSSATAALSRTRAPGRKRIERVQGTEPGVYGGTRNAASCNVQQLVGFLNERPDAAQAWARVERIDAVGLPDYVRRMTPVILAVDTRVTNHGFDHGRAIPRRSILQAGTTVLVDNSGVPRVRCSGGNPLTAPGPAERSALIGRPWRGFSSSRAQVIVPGPRDRSLLLTDPKTGQHFTRFFGGDGSDDRDAPPIPLRGVTPTVTTKTLSGTKSSQPYDYTMKFPQLAKMTDKKTEKSINDRIRQDMDGFLTRFRASISDALFRYSATSDFETTLLNPRVASFRINAVTTNMGFQGRVLTLSFDLKSGKFLKLADLFAPGAPYIQELTPQLVAKLEALNIPGLSPSTPLSGESLPTPREFKFTDPDLVAFALTPSGIDITFQRCQVGVCAAGPVKVSIAYADMTQPCQCLAVSRSLLARPGLLDWARGPIAQPGST